MKRTSFAPSASTELNRHSGAFVFWNQRNCYRHQNGVEDLGGQRPSRRTEVLLKQGLDGVVPGQGGYETEMSLWGPLLARYLVEYSDTVIDEEV